MPKDALIAPIPDDIVIPSQALYAILDETVARFPRSIAIDFEGETLTYAQLGEKIDKMARGLQKKGIGKGSKVALCLPNSPYYLISYYAILKAGGTVVNLNPLQPAKEMVHLLNTSKAQMVIAIGVKDVYDNLKEAVSLSNTDIKVVHASLADALPRVKKWGLKLVNAAPIKWLLKKIKKFDTISKGVELSQKSKDDLSFNDFLKHGTMSDVPVIDPENDVALLQFTGGTTGLPKAVMLTHQNLTANTHQASAWFKGVKQGEDSMLAVIPFFHVFAMTVAMNLSIKNGLKIIALPKFDPQTTLKTIQDKKPTLFPGIPTLYAKLMNEKNIKEFDLSSIQYCIAGGMPLAAEVKAAFEKITGCVLVEGYGLSESSPVAVCNPLDGENKPKSIGLPLPNTTIELIDIETGELVTEFNKKGEICIRGPQVMKGYFNNKAATDETIKDGRLHTGDVAYRDEDGYYFIIDRIKDLIITNGYNVYPRHVEDVIYEMDAVQECIVGGMARPDRPGDEMVVAWIKVKDGEVLDKQALNKLFEEKLTFYQRPKEIIYEVEDLPKTDVGKLSRKDVIKREKQRREDREIKNKSVSLTP